MLYEFTEIKDNYLINRCAIKFFINVVNVTFVYWRFFLLKKWIKVRINFFLLDSERDFWFYV
jgi:hypothetical protein